MTRIGWLTKDTALVLRTTAGDRALPTGYEHFKAHQPAGDLVDEVPPGASARTPHTGGLCVLIEHRAII